MTVAVPCPGARQEGVLTETRYRRRLGAMRASVAVHLGRCPVCGRELRLSRANRIVPAHHPPGAGGGAP